MQGARPAGFGRDHQAAGAVLAAQDDDSAAAKLRHGAFDGATAAALREWAGVEFMALGITPRDFAEVNHFCAQIVPDRVNFEMADR